jgi:hypothetical protein
MTQPTMIKESDPYRENVALINHVIDKFRGAKPSAPVRHRAIDIRAEKATYKLIRINDDQFRILRKNCVPISEDYTFLFHLSRMDDLIYSSQAKMYATLKDLFGESGEYYDDWKGSFSFPFLIHFRKEDREFGYLLKVYNFRSSIEFGLYKLIREGDEEVATDRYHDPFNDFSMDEINYVIGFLVSFLSGYFETARAILEEPFFHAVESNLILFGCKDGEYFDRDFDNEEEFQAAIEELKAGGIPMRDS